MFNLTYYIIFIFFYSKTILELVKSHLINDTIVVTTLKKKSFFDLSIYEQLLLLLFYDNSKKFSYYNKVLNDRKIIYILRNQKYKTLVNFFSSLPNKIKLKSFINFNTNIKLWKLIKFYKLEKFWIVTPINFNLVYKNFFLSFIFNNYLLSEKYCVNDYYNCYKNLLLNIFFKKTLRSANHNVNTFVYTYKINQLVEKKYPKRSSNFLKIFKKVENFYQRTKLVSKNHNVYWRWITANTNSFKLYILNNKFYNYLQQQFPIRYLPTTTSKYINPTALKNTKIYFLRKTKIFNKSRYSRNRQLYRTGVYWCLWVSIFLGWGLYFIFYRYTLTFSYLWWLVYIGLSLFIFIKSLKYRFYNIVIVLNECKNIIKWIYLLIKEFLGVVNALYNFIILILKQYIISSILNFNFFFKLTFILISGLNNISPSLMLLINKNFFFKDFIFNTIYPFKK